MDGCLSDEDLTAYVGGSISPNVRERWDAHLWICHRCRGRLAKRLRTPERRTMPRAFVSHMLEEVESTGEARPPPEEQNQPPAGAGGGLLAYIRKRRLSKEEINLLKRMARAEGRAMVLEGPGQPRHVFVGGKPILDPNDDAVRTNHLRALEKGLPQRGLAATFQGQTYTLTEKGWAKARRLG